MIGDTWIARTLVAIAGITVAVVLAAPGTAKPTVKGDTVAWAEIVAAYRKLNNLSGYRIRGEPSAGGRVPQGSHLLVEVAPPARAYHLSMQAPRGTFEVFAAGGKVVRKVSGVGCAAARQDPVRIPFLRDPEDPRSNETFTISRKPDSVIDGAPAHAYEVVAEEGPGQSYPLTVYIGSQTGLPRRFVDTEITGDYYDYGAKISIALPNC